MTRAARRRGDVAVLGAGLQGCCAAMALACAGWRVTIVDRAPRPMLGASLHNEGKIHLGYVYANEPTRRTAQLMAEGAMSFSGLLDGWLPRPVPWPALRSDAMYYVVDPDTIVAVDDLAAHYAYVDAIVSDRIADGASYVGLGTVSPVEPVGPGDVPRLAAQGAPVFRTGEVAVDMRRLAPRVVAGLDHHGVALSPGREVLSVERTATGFVVHHRAVHGGGRRPGRLHADAVVNCLWEGRMAVDATLGIRPSRPWVHRLRRSVIARAPDDTGPPVPSFTVVLGPFGDVVSYPGGDVYLSWYPSCLAGWSTELRPPHGWGHGADGEPDVAFASEVVAALSRYSPALSSHEPTTTQQGVIVAFGDTDIDDPASALHARDGVGVQSHDGYVSVDTGKLTTAPLFAAGVPDVL